MIYPAKGQSQEQTEKDKFERYTWAKQQTGFDPMETPTATAPPPENPQSNVGKDGVKTGVKGALLGAASATNEERY
jgi:hypothetical protein